MAETALTAAQANALSGTSDTTAGVTYPTILESTYYTTMYRVLEKLLRMAKVPGNSLRVFKDGDLTFGVTAGHFYSADSAFSYAGASAQALTDDSANYIYLTIDSGVATLNVSTSTFPTPSVTEFIPLAVVTTADGAYAYTAIVDWRDAMLNRLLT